MVVIIREHYADIERALKVLHNHTFAYILQRVLFNTNIANL